MGRKRPVDPLMPMNPRMLPAILLACAFGAAAAAAAPKPARVVKAASPAPKPEAMTLEQARTTVRMMDDAYQLLLHRIHDWYPNRGGRAVVAATVIRQVQEKVSRKGPARSRFLAVSGMLMNPDHRPNDAFERQAVTALKGGDEWYESVEKGQLRVATLVPLGGGCSSCHWSNAGHQSKAAISWVVPLKK